MPKKRNRPAQYAATSYLKKLDIVNFFDSLTFGVLFVDLDHRVIAINRFLEALTGYNREEVKGVLGENVLRSNLASLGNPIHTTLSNNKPLTIEGDIINQSRKKTPIRFTISPLRLQNGKNGGVIVVLEDISILKDLDNKVHSFSGKDELPTGISFAQARPFYYDNGEKDPALLVFPFWQADLTKFTFHNGLVGKVPGNFLNNISDKIILH